MRLYIEGKSCVIHGYSGGLGQNPVREKKSLEMNRHYFTKNCRVYIIPYKLISSFAALSMIKILCCTP